jgi:sugar phosphate isomerase/epimerase
LEIASPDRTRREASVKLARQICLDMAEFDPKYYILHIPFSLPTLVAIPGLYFTTGEKQEWDEWTKRALGSLEILHEVFGQADRLLVENINYSPSFLEPLLKKGLYELCLDLGHLMLGQENVMESIKQYLDVTRVIHLHGVKGYEEHLSLSILPKTKVHRWLKYLIKAPFKGVITLEMFSPQDLEESMDVVLEALCLGKGE